MKYDMNGGITVVTSIVIDDDGGRPLVSIEFDGPDVPRMELIMPLDQAQAIADQIERVVRAAEAKFSESLDPIKPRGTT